MATAAGHKNVEGVLTEARATLDTAGVGLDDFLHGRTPGRRLAGLRNVIVFGRAVTNVVQNIRTFDRDHFDRWYEPRQRAMRENAEFKYLAELRNQVLKEGILGGTTASMHIEYFNTNQLSELPKAPPGAKAFFMGDFLGGSGWQVELADGTTETYYVELPTTWKVQTDARFAGVTTDLGLEPPKTPIDRLLRDYLRYLGDLITDARREFVT